MAWGLTVYSLGGFAAAGVSLALTAVARGRSESYVRPFVWLMAFVAVWAGLYSVQIGFQRLTQKLLLFRFVAVVGVPVSTLWLLFVVRYVGIEDRAPSWRLLAAEPVVVSLLGLTNGFHGLFWTNPRLQAGETPSLTVSLEPAFVIHAVYSQLLVVVGLALLAWTARTGGTVSRRQSQLLIVGALPPFVASTLTLLGIGVSGFDTTPFSFVVTGVVWGLALFRFDLLERSTSARRHALQKAESGLAVTDEEGNVIEIDELARKVLGDMLPPDGKLKPTVPDGAGRDTLDGGYRTAVIDGRRRVFDTTVEPLSDHRGRTTGYAVVVHDVTTRHASQKRLEVANRVLRHNLSNELNVVVGHANHVAERTDDPELQTAATEIHTAATELLDTSEKARELVGFKTSDIEPVAVDLAEPTRRVAAEFDPVADVRLSVTDATAVVESRRDYRTALSNLVENAVEHHDGDPTVWIEVTAGADGDSVVVAVADDGPGVPETDRLTVERGTETPLEHASGLGLWIVRWTATAVGGDLSICDRDPRGTRVELTLPTADGDQTDAGGP